LMGVDDELIFGIKEDKKIVMGTVAIGGDNWTLHCVKSLVSD
jgi:hypothetical protein